MSNSLESMENYEGTELTSGYRKPKVKTLDRDFKNLKMVRVKCDKSGKEYNVPTYVYVKKESI